LLATLVESARRFGAQVQSTPEVREAFAVAFAEATERERWTPEPNHGAADLVPRPHAQSRPHGRPVRARPVARRRPHEDAAEFLLLTTAEDRTDDRLRVGEALSSLLLTATNAELATMPISLDPRGDVLRWTSIPDTPRSSCAWGGPSPAGADAPRTRRRDLTSVLVPSAS
jgi:hypothetical protein